MPDEDFSIQASALNHWFGAGEARKQALFDIDLRMSRDAGSGRQRRAALALAMSWLGGSATGAF